MLDCQRKIGRLAAILHPIIARLDPMWGWTRLQAGTKILALSSALSVRSAR
jgi:hypothetical protein